MLAHAISPDAAHDAARRPLGRRIDEAVRAHFDRAALTLVDRVEDPSDGFVKYLFRSPDGALSEAVRIPLFKEGTYSVCLSSQVGCAMKCDFCATGRLGLSRNLAAWEIVGAFLGVRADTEGRLSNAVFMGQGEPFHNYDEVIRAARVLSHSCGGRVRANAITISTVGLVPQIRRFTAEGHHYKLIVSLTSAIAAKRRSLVPIAGGRHSLEETAAAIRAHAQATGDRVTVAWVLMAGVNDGPDEVAALQSLFAGTKIRLNLIDVNDARASGYRRATDAKRNEFIDRLQILQIPIVRRYSGGSSKHAACGMLAARRAAD